MSQIKLPSRYEDLDTAFRGRLRPNRPLVELVKSSLVEMNISGGIRFLPVYGESGAGKTCATLELGVHLPGCVVVKLTRDEMASREALVARIAEGHKASPALVIAVVDQYEETAADESLPKKFVETISLVDRDELRALPTLFLWLTTTRDFQTQLADATSRNRRILLQNGFALHGPDRCEWVDIIEETFSFHNDNRGIADFAVVQGDIGQIVDSSSTLGECIESIGRLLAKNSERLQDLSEYLVVMLWPVADATRISRVLQFSDNRNGYRLSWDAFYRELTSDDQAALPLHEYNRARLYFDVRLIPIAVADLEKLCVNLQEAEGVLHKTYVDRFMVTHFATIITDKWDPAKYAPLRERESIRARSAKEWYESVTRESTAIGRRIAQVLRERGIEAHHEQTIETKHSKVRADVLVVHPVGDRRQTIVEMKCYSTENTRPSSIRDAIRETLKRHAQLAGFLARQ